MDTSDHSGSVGVYWIQLSVTWLNFEKACKNENIILEVKFTKQQHKLTTS